MFTQEGNPLVKITDACICISPYNENDLAVALKVADVSDPNQSDFWYGVLNDEFGIGNYAGRMRKDITIEDLEKIGWKHGKNLSNDTLKDLIGTETVAWVKAREYEKDGETKTAYSVKTLGGKSFEPKKVDAADVDAKLRALWGAGAGTPAKESNNQEQPASTPDAGDDNPFG